MPYEFKAVRRVEFSDTDMAGIMHYANFFRFMETVEHAFFRSMGFSIWMGEHVSQVGWPRVHAECDYRSPLRFEDEVEMHLIVREKRARSLSYQIRFRKLNAQPPVEVARGMLVVVCVRKDEHGVMQAAPIPEELAARLEVAPRELLEG